MGLRISRGFCLALLLAATATHAQHYPIRPVRLIVPFTPGGGVDIVARTLAQKMSEGLGQSIVIDNRAGAGGAIGMELGARAAPDGYTLLIASSTITINPALYKNLPFDARRDFTPISRTSVIPLVLVTTPALPVANVKDIIALARERKGCMTYASSGIGVSVHLAMELLLNMTQVLSTFSLLAVGISVLVVRPKSTQARRVGNWPSTKRLRRIW